MLNGSTGISVQIIVDKDDHVAAINTALRDAGHAAHCLRVNKPGDLEAAIEKRAPELILLFAEADSIELKQVAEIRNLAEPNTPVLLVNDKVDEATIVTAMANGARDVISLANVERLQAVAGRELRTCRLENALEKMRGSASQYKQELHSLKQVTVEAIADIQEGIIVNVNPAWLELFNLAEGTDLTGHPLMDMCAKSDQPTLKGGLVACQKGKWADSKLDIKGVREDGSEFPLSLNLENTEYDGEPAVRALVTPEQPDEQMPAVMIEQAIQRDQATGFFNRSHFLSTVGNRLEQAPAGGVRAVAYIRPDKFSKALDDIGLVGTENIITQLAQILRDFTQPDDIYGRFGGTMFSIMLERGTMPDVEAWAEQLLNTINDSVFEHGNRSTVITCSIGICEVDSTKSSIDKLLGDAEGACRAGRTEGGNRIQLSESSGAAKKVRQDDNIWIPKIRGALMENRLRLEHQTIGSLNEDIEGAFDTLVRMLDEEGNTILPSEFMPVAERTGLSKNIDRWIIGASLSFCDANNAQLVFIRLSADSLLDESLPEWLKKQVSQTKINPSRICFEIPEDAVTKHLRQTQKLVKAIRTDGFKFAVEHFGRAEDSSRIITHIPMDFMKIDGSLMQGLHKNFAVQNKVKEFVLQAKEKQIQTVAERVQDANTMAVLWQLGISFIQGNYVQNQEIIMEDTSRSSVTTQALNAETEVEAPA
jgi:diguanylate cyclase (GGDEF)-like protein